MSNNIELIGIQSNKVDKAETEIVKRIIEAHSKNQSQEEVAENAMIGIRFKLNSYLNDELNKDIIEAGQFLSDILKVFKIKKNKFANYIGLSEPNLYALLKGRRKINNEVAKKLELIFGIDAQAWLFVETKNAMMKYNASNNISKKDYSIKELVKVR